MALPQHYRQQLVTSTPHRNPHPNRPPPSTGLESTVPFARSLDYSFNIIPRRKPLKAATACQSCRRLKAKCDEKQPCKICVDRSLDCVYRDPTTRLQSQTDRIEENVSRILDKLQKEPETDRPSHKMEQDVSLILEKLDKRFETSIEEEVQYSVDDCSQSFQTYILPAYPIFNPDELDIAKKIVEMSEEPVLTKRRRTGKEPIQRAEALLIYASGRLCSGMTAGECGISAQGKKAFTEALRLMEIGQDGGNIRANILAAAHCLLLCRGEASIPYVETAGSELVDLAGRGFVHLKSATAAKVVSSEDNNFLVLCWTCFMMESDLVDIGLNTSRTLTSNHDLDLPSPNIALAIQDGLKYNVIARFLKTTLIYRQRFQPVDKREGREWLDPKAKEDLKKLNPNAIPTNVFNARFLAMCWEARLSISQDHIKSILVKKAGYNTKNVRGCIKALVKSTGAFQSVLKGRNIMVNALSIAHTQLRNLLLLGECHARQDLQQYCTPAILKQAYHQTILLLESMPALSIAKAILAPLEAQMYFGATSRTSSISRIALCGLVVDGEPSFYFDPPTGRTTPRTVPSSTDMQRMDKRVGDQDVADIAHAARQWVPEEAFSTEGQSHLKY